MKQKPVWRVSIGDLPPKDDSLYPYKIACANGSISKASMCVDFSLQDQPDDVVAYQTTRTKPAKYERVECVGCCGTGQEGWLDSATDKFIEYPTKCPNCNGKGYRLEKIK